MIRAKKKTVIVGAVAAVFMLCMGLFLLPEAAWAKTFNGKMLKVKYPVGGEVLEITNPAGLSKQYSSIQYTLYHGSEEIYNSSIYHDSSAVKKLCKVESAPERYKLHVELFLALNDGYTTEPNSSGWGVEFTSTYGYSKTIEATDVEIMFLPASANFVPAYRITFNVEFYPLNTINSIWLDASSKLVLSDGDLGDYDIEPSLNDTWYDTGTPKWYPEGSTSPISTKDKLVGGQYYRLEIPVSFATPEGWSLYCGRYDKKAGKDSPLDRVLVRNAEVFYDWDNGFSDTYSTDTKIYTAVLDYIPVTRPIEALNITGITAPQNGKTPVTGDIALSLPEANDKHPAEAYIVAKDGKRQVNWEGTFDKDGSFIAGNHYVLSIVCKPDMTGDIGDLYSYTGFVKDKIKPNTGTVESVAFNSSSDESTVKIGFDCPKFNISSAAVKAADQTYTGSALTPVPTVTLNGATLTKDTDYTIAYSNNTNVGTATVTVTGKGKYTGTASGTFAIHAKPLTAIGGAVVTAADQTFTGSPLTPAPSVKLGTTVLTKDKDYTVSYSGNVNVGTAKITVSGKGEYTGSASGSFKITAKSLAGAKVTAANQTYTGSALTPAPKVVLDGKTLEPGRDYTAAYGNNVNAGTATITVTGKGNYTGTASGTFTITKPAETPAAPTTAPTTAPTEPTTAPAETTVAARAAEDISPDKPAKLADVQKAITTAKNDNDQKGSTFSLLQAKGVAKSATAIKISWTKVPGTKKYIIYGNKCGKGQKYVKLATVKKSKTSWTQKKLKKGTYYKYMVVAVNGSKVLATSKTVHVATNGGTGKKGNAAAITLNKKSISVTAGKTTKKVKATVKAGKLKAAVHRKVKWESDNIGVAKVNSKGYITGVSKGTCYVYAYAQNGLCAKVKVKVK